MIDFIVGILYITAIGGDLTLHITYQFRIKDSSISWLNKAAKSVNYVWNYCNETSFDAIRNNGKFFSGYDFQKLTSGCAKELGLNSATVQLVGHEYATKRKQFKKIKLKWRSRKSLGWIPLRHDGFQIVNDTVKYAGNKARFWYSREIEGKIKCGSFSQDARGRWYLNITCKIENNLEPAKENAIGIDLGLKDLATTSDGQKFKANRYYRKHERLLGLAQKDGKKKRVKSLHAKITNSRKDTNHKISHELTRDNNVIVVGNVSSSKLVKTNMAKSVLDAGWSQLKNFLGYKAIRRQGKVIEVSEYLTSQVCSTCNTITDSSPKGMKDLGIRTWVCTCGSVNDRDINAAKNILNKFRIGHDSLALK